MAKAKEKPGREAPMWFKVIVVLLGIGSVLFALAYLISGDLVNFFIYIAPLLILILLYLILKSVRKTLSNWDYLLLLILFFVARSLI